MDTGRARPAPFFRPDPPKNDARRDTKRAGPRHFLSHFQVFRSQPLVEWLIARRRGTTIRDRKGHGRMVSATSERTGDGQLLSEAVKLVRRSRGLSTREVAAAMHMSVRTYQRFEAGVTRLNLDHIHRFARATSSDPYAILMSVMIGSSRFARNTADNRLSTVLIVGVQNLDQSVGDRISELDTRTLVGAVANLFDGFAAQIRGRDPAQEWLAKGQDDLSAKRPTPGR